jgi:excisionase family DNA binding protein
MTNDFDLLTVSEFASGLRVKPSCVRRWIRERKITITHVGRLVRIPRTEIQRIISAGTRPAITLERKGARDGGRSS